MIIFCQVLEAARDKFTLEISFQSKDKDISLAKVLFLLLLAFLLFLVLFWQVRTFFIIFSCFCSLLAFVVFSVFRLSQRNGTILVHENGLCNALPSTLLAKVSGLRSNVLFFNAFT